MRKSGRDDSTANPGKGLGYLFSCESGSHAIANYQGKGGNDLMYIKRDDVDIVACNLVVALTGCEGIDGSQEKT